MGGKTIDDALLLQKIQSLPQDSKVEEQGYCAKSGAVSLTKTHWSLLRKLLGMKDSMRFYSGYMFLFEKCLLICMKMKSRKEKFQMEALIHVADLDYFLKVDD